MVKCIYIDADKKWWLAEFVEELIWGDIRIIEEFPEKYKGAWKDDFIEIINECAPWILYFGEEGQTCGTPFGERKIID